MRQFKEHGNSVFYIEDVSDVLIEYNLITKCKCKHFETKFVIYDYYITSENDLIVFYSGFDDYRIIWNQYILKLKLNRYNLSTAMIVLEGKTYLHIWHNNDPFLYSKDGKFKNVNFFPYHREISDDGKKWIVIKDGQICVESTNINCMFYDSSIACRSFSWLTNSSRFALNFWNDTVINVTTKLGRKFTCIDRLFDTGDYILLHCLDSENKIVVYDVANFNELACINCSIEFLIYHKRLNVLVAKNFDCYKITPDYKLQKIDLFKGAIFCPFRLQKIVFGQNYILDFEMIENPVMNVILDSEMLFDLLPYEIICIELYQQILSCNQFLACSLGPKPYHIKHRIKH